MFMVLLGPPGAGKGTQAKLIEKQWQMTHVSTGDLLRAAIRDQTDCGKIARQFMERGELVPDELVINMIEERVGVGSRPQRVVLDGFPRNVRQAGVLEHLMTARAWRLDHVVSLNVPREELVRRLCGRRTCLDCGEMYHVEFEPPRCEGICDECGGSLYQRDDDHETTIRARLDVYERETAPVRDFYSARHLLREIDGVGRTDEVFARIVAQVSGGQ